MNKSEIISYINLAIQKIGENEISDGLEEAVNQLEREWEYELRQEEKNEISFNIHTAEMV